MKITAMEEYGLRCMVQLARHGHLPITELAELEGIGASYVAKLMRVLRTSGLVASERGKGGGYRLSKKAEDTSLREVLAVLSRPLYSERFCATHGGERDGCVHIGGCHIRNLWSEIHSAVDRVLEGINLAHLASGEIGLEHTSAPTAEVAGVDCGCAAGSARALQATEAS